MAPREVESISSMFELVVNYALYSTFIISNIFCLVFAVEKNSYLVKSTKLPAPKNLRYFLCNILLGVLSVLQYQYQAINLYTTNGNIAYLLVVINITIFLIMTFTSMIVIGVAMQHFCIKVEQAKITAMPASSKDIFDPLVKDFQKLKDGLGPQLFLIFFIKSIIIIYYAYQMLVGNGLGYLWAGIIELLALEYLIIVVDNTYEAFKNTSKTLR
jgi:hypothetical protein